MYGCMAGSDVAIVVDRGGADRSFCYCVARDGGRSDHGQWSHERAEDY